ncbi:leucyl aminopeptidase family protein [Actinomadura sp. KC345]|uniref:leucyl aminopeptidase family protein n=1 Tax=Actinomadura sp. KC345 TaxID=2530371 RepID=UPI001044099B|nr:leucyl aminopeptidase family protein [Actinomadura sp. KC345]TDC58262.1 leucyl aminopeptidase family protein [Actinomadura sp. KC345]
MPIETRIHGVGGTVSETAVDLGAEVVAVPVRQGPVAPAAEVAGSLPFTLDELLALHNAKGEPGEITSAQVRVGDRVRELLLYGVGDAAPADLRKAGAALARRGKGRTALVAGVPTGDTPDALAAFVEGVLLACYEFKIGKAPAKRAPGTIAVLTEAGPEADAAAIELGTVRARATALARDLANTPSREKDPAWLAGQAEQVAADSGLTVRVRGEKELVEEGFGGLVAVGAGSSRPPRLIELSYDPRSAGGSGGSSPQRKQGDPRSAGGPGGSSPQREQGPEGEPERHVVLVGKGITFDSGGLSLKPNEGMKAMKTDMAGGGAVIAVMSALRDLGVRARVTGLVAAAENMPSGSAMRPGDVIAHYGGKTSEVLNTDAEGRLVLADALAYADAELDPDVLVDVATLTGAAKVALGLRHGALFSTDDDLAAALTGAGTAAGDPVWRLPLVDDYRAAIDSDVADINNIGRGGYGGGSITAALFLREFAGDRAWAHLDIAGPGRAASDDAETTRGATGFGTRLLLRWLAG